MADTATIEQPATVSDDLWTSESSTPQSSGEPSTSDVSAAPTPEPAAAVTDPAPADAQPSEPAQPKPNPRKNPQARVEQATAQAAAARAELQRAQARIQELEAATARQPQPAARETAPQPEAKTPTDGRFPKFAEWIEQHPDRDLDDYLEAREEHTLTQAQTRWQTQYQQTMREQRFAERMKELTAAHPDLPQILAQYDPVVSPLMTEAIKDSERGADIVHWLATHPDQCLQLAEDSKETPAAAAPLMRRYLESQLTAQAAATASPDSAPKARPSSALPPVNRVGGTTNATPLEPDDLDFGPEFIRKGNEADRKRKELSRW